MIADAYIPIATEQMLDVSITAELASVCNALRKHVNNVWVHPTREYYPRYLAERLDRRGGTIDMRRYKAITKNVLDCFKLAIARGAEYFIMCNSQKMSDKIPHVPELQEEMIRDKSLGVVAPSHIKLEKGGVHIASGFVLCRTEAIQKVTFDIILNGGYRGCHCRALTNEVREAGWKMEYLFTGSNSK